MAKRKPAPKPKVEGAPQKATPFTAIKAISENRPLTYRDLQEQNAPYEPFLVNRAFSLTEDTVYAANLMNLRGFLDPDAQATFYIHTLRPRKRFEKWPKTVSDEEVSVIAQYYGMSKREAKLYIHLHSEEQLKSMSELLATGARPNRSR